MICEKFERRCLHALFACAISIAAMISAPAAFPQNSDFFDVKPVIRDVQRRFRLTATDVRYVSPLIRQDSSDLLLIYNRFGGGEPEYSRSLWRDLAEQRVSFEARIGARLTQRQATAVRAARGALEKRIIGRVLDDYLQFIIAELELDDLEIEAVNHIFEKDSRTKLNAIVRYQHQPERLEKELERSTLETESWLSKILAPEQMRLYRSLSQSTETLIAAR